MRSICDGTSGLSELERQKYVDMWTKRRDRRESNGVNVRLPQTDHNEIPEKSRGLGDTVAKFTRVTGIRRVVSAVSAVTGIPCGCPGRQAALNALVPYEATE